MLERAADDIQTFRRTAQFRVARIVQPLVGKAQAKQVRDEVLYFGEGVRAIALQILRDAPGIIDVGADPVHIAFFVMQRPAELPDAILGVTVLESIPDTGDGAVKVPGTKILKFRSGALRLPRFRIVEKGSERLGQRLDPDKGERTIFELIVARGAKTVVIEADAIVDRFAIEGTHITDVTALEIMVVLAGEPAIVGNDVAQVRPGLVDLGDQRAALHPVDV